MGAVWARHPKPPKLPPTLSHCSVRHSLSVNYGSGDKMQPEMCVWIFVGGLFIRFLCVQTPNLHVQACVCVCVRCGLLFVLTREQLLTALTPGYFWVMQS